MIVPLYRRIVLLLVLAVFTAGAVAETVVMQGNPAGMMSSAMENAEMKGAGVEMGECIDCLSGSGDYEVCAADCVTPMGVALGASPFVYAMAVQSFPIALVKSPIDTTNPPEPFPPRSSRLI